MRAGVVVAAVIVALALPLHVGAQAALPVFDISHVFRQEADFQRAIQPYQAAIAADARNARAHYWLGYAYLNTYRQYKGGLAPYAASYLPRALASLRQAVQLDASFVPAIISLHDALVLSGLWEEAEALVKRFALQIRPSGPGYTFP